MELQMRKALKEAMWKRYRKAPKKMKTQILDELRTITGYHRQYAIAQLKQMKDAEPPRHAGPAVGPAEENRREDVQVSRQVN